MARRTRHGTLVVIVCTLIGFSLCSRAALANCQVTPQGDVNCNADTATTDTTNVDGAEANSSARTQHFSNGSPIDATIGPHVAVHIGGLALDQGLRLGVAPEPITIVNKGLIAADEAIFALELDGNGGLIRYSGDGAVTNLNADATEGAAIGANNVFGDIAITTGRGAIAGPYGILANTTHAGRIAITTGSGTITGGVGGGIEAVDAHGGMNLRIGSGGVSDLVPGYSAVVARSWGGVIKITANGPVIGGPTSATVAPPAITAIAHGAGNIMIGGSGSVVGLGGRGIVAEQGGTGTGQVVVTGTGNTVAMGAVCPANTGSAVNGTTGCSAIRAVILNPADTQSILVNRSGDIAATAAAINGRTLGSGNVLINTGLNAQLFSTFEFGLEAESSGTGSIVVTTNGPQSTITTGGTGILAENEATAIPNSLRSSINVTATGTIDAANNPYSENNKKNPFGILAGISAGYLGGTNPTLNPNVGGTVNVFNAATLNAGLGDGIFAYDFGMGSVSVANIGTITAPTGIGLRGSPAVRYAITNSGTITGSVNAIDLSGAGGPVSINQQGGTITGNVLLSSHGDTLTITGGAIAGNIVGNSAMNGAHAGSVIFNEAGAITGGTIDVASINLTGGQLTLANDVTVFTAFTNAAVLGLVGNATRTINGNYAQPPAGTLSVAINPGGAARLNIAGTAALAGTLALQYAPGSYIQRVYPILTATGGITGSFAATTEAGAVPSGLPRELAYTGNGVDLVLGGLPTVYTPQDSSLFGAQDALLALLAQQTLSTLLGTDGSAGDCSGPAFAASPAPSAGAEPALPFCRAGGWVQLAYLPMQADGSGSMPGYSANAVHLLTGFDWKLADGRFRVGVAAGYDQGWLDDTTGGQAGVQVGRIAAYGSTQIERMIVTATLGYGHDWDTTQRATGGGAVSASHGGNEFAAGVQARLPIPLGDDYTLTPMGGLRLVVFDQGGFVESGVGAATPYATSGARSAFNDVVPYARLRLSRDWGTADGLRISPEIQVGFDYQAGTGNPTVLLSASDGIGFVASGLRLDRSSAVLDAGLGVGRGNWTAFANVHANLAGNWSSETVQAGLRLAF